MLKYGYTKTKMMGSSRAPGNSGIALLNDFELSTRAGRGSTDKPRKEELARGPGVAIHCDLICAACLDYPFQWELRAEAGYQSTPLRPRGCQYVHSWWEGGGEGCWRRQSKPWPI